MGDSLFVGNVLGHKVCAGRCRGLGGPAGGERRATSRPPSEPHPPASPARQSDIADGTLRTYEFRSYENIVGDYYISPRCALKSRVQRSAAPACQHKVGSSAPASQHLSLAPRRCSFLERVAVHVAKNYLVDAGAFDPQTRVPLLLGIWVRPGLGGGWRAGGAGALPGAPRLSPPCAALPTVQGGKGQGKTFQTELAFKKLG